MRLEVNPVRDQLMRGLWWPIIVSCFDLMRLFCKERIHRCALMKFVVYSNGIMVNFCSSLNLTLTRLISSVYNCHRILIHINPRSFKFEIVE